MDNLLNELEALKITGDLSHGDLWTGCKKLAEDTFVPQNLKGLNEPLDEIDFREYLKILDRNLKNLLSALRNILVAWESRENSLISFDNRTIQCFVINFILIIGEQSERNVWNTAESVNIANKMKSCICRLFKCENLSQILMGIYFPNMFNEVLVALRPKLLKDCWKSYPAAVVCYKWLLFQIEVPGLSYHIGDVLPTALIILDDWLPENRVLAVESLQEIVKHAHMRDELGKTGYADVIFSALKPLMSQRRAECVIPLYSCLADVLITMEFYDTSMYTMEWTKRDDVLAILLDMMEFEPDSELRYCCMTSLPRLLTDIGSAKWCKRITRILSEYCEHHGDLRTLAATMEAAKVFLLTFHPRVPANCTALYTAFLKLHLDLNDSQVCNEEIVQNLKTCVCLLRKLTPTVAVKLGQDPRIKSIVKNNAPWI